MLDTLTGFMIENWNAGRALPGGRIIRTGADRCRRTTYLGGTCRRPVGGTGPDATVHGDV
jgi:hypothetical protein